MGMASYLVSGGKVTVTWMESGEEILAKGADAPEVVLRETITIITPAE